MRLVRLRSTMIAGLVVLASAGVVQVVGGDERGSEVSAAMVAEPAPAVLLPPAVSILPRDQATNIAPRGQVSVTATSGVLTRVAMTNENGRVVAGSITSDGMRWTPAEPLGYGRTYTVEVTSRGTDRSTTTEVSQFSTVTPSTQVGVNLTTTAGIALRDGSTMGVGTVVVARFDGSVVDRSAAERAMTVRTDPPIEGSWSWINDTTVHWRPPEYYPSGTDVEVRADLYGVPLGDGVFGADDESVRFSIGDSRIAIADDATKQITVYENGRLVRTMPTSMGRGGSETVNGNVISFWTQPGIYTVMDQANPVLMDSSTYGLPVDSPSGYRISVPYATRISPDGIYLHEREATVWAQGNTNVSAGCLNLSAANAEWYYNFAQPGDVVEIRNTGGAPLEQWQNGDWSVAWSKWLQGSAL